MDYDFVDIFVSRRDNFDECKYWCRKPNENPNELVYEMRKPDGYFDAKMSNPENFGTDVVGGVFMFDTNFVMIETNDDVFKLKANDVVEFRGKIYMITDIQKRPLRKNNQFTNELAYKYYISLRG